MIESSSSAGCRLSTIDCRYLRASDCPDMNLLGETTLECRRQPRRRPVRGKGLVEFVRGYVIYAYLLGSLWKHHNWQHLV